MALPIAAAPIAKMFLDAIGLSIAGLAAKDIVDVANKYIEDNPDESIKILSTIVPNIGIGQIFMSKEDKISLEDLDEMTDEEAQDLSKEEKAELMKQAGKRRDRELSIATSEKIGPSGPGKEKQDIEYEIDERYDEGGVEQKKAPFDYTKFFRKRRADGGAIRKNFSNGGDSDKDTREFQNKYIQAAIKLASDKNIGIGDAMMITSDEDFDIDNMEYKGSSKGILEILNQKADGGAIGIEVLFEEKKPRKNFRVGGASGREYGATTKASQSVKTSSNRPDRDDRGPTLVAELTPKQKKFIDKQKFGLQENLVPARDIFNKITNPKLGIFDTGTFGFGAQEPTTEEEFNEYLKSIGVVQQVKDGGRVGFNLGGLLTGQAKSIYDNMTAAGYFTEDEIRNAITNAGYEIPDAASTPAPDTGIIGAQLNNDRGSTPIGAPSSLVSAYKTQTQERQNRLTNPNKTTEFFNKFTGGGQRDIGEMIRSGQVDKRKLAGIPTVGNIIGKALPDSYYNMSLGDQVFTQAMSGYTGPTVFGENLGNQDPFGLNVRSGFGNYAEAVGKDFASLRESLTGRLADKYGVEFDEETGMFVGKNAALANKMTNMMRTKFNFRKDQLAAKNRLDAQIKAAEAERQKQEAIKQAAFEQARRDRDTAVASGLDKAIREGRDTSGFDRPSSGAYAEKAGMGVGGGYASDFGYDFKNGGLASMFVEKR